MVVQVRRGGKTIGVPGSGRMVRQHVRPQAMRELLKGRALKWFIANNKQWKTWAEFVERFHTYFLPRDFFTGLDRPVQAIQKPSGSASPGGHARQESAQRTRQRRQQTSPAATSPHGAHWGATSGPKAARRQESRGGHYEYPETQEPAVVKSKRRHDEDEEH